MNIIELFQTFQTNEQSIEYLETKRWRGKANCPYCKSKRVGFHASGDRAMRRHHCGECNRAFAVTVGTVFHRTHIPLRDWFLIIAMMLNAKKSVSSCQMARDLGMRQATVWSIMHRIRAAMALDPEQKELFHGIVEADETYIGGKPRKGNKAEDRHPHPRGRGTAKTPVIGVLERGGRVHAQVADRNSDLTSRGLERFIKRFVEKDGTILMTDENPAYNRVGRQMFHAVINHSMAYVEELTHTNGIEGFWALVKRAWIGQHHHYSEKYMPLYIAEACYKFNRRTHGDAFENSITAFLGKR